MSDKRKSRPSYTDINAGGAVPPADANPPEPPAKPNVNRGPQIAALLILAGWIATSVLFVGLFLFHKQTYLLLAMGIVGATATFGLFLWRLVADNGMNQRFSKTLSSSKSLLAPMQILSNEILSLRQDLDKNRQLAQAVHDAVTRPEFKASPSQLASVEKAVSLLQDQLSRMDRKLTTPAISKQAQNAPVQEFVPAPDSSAAQRLEQALAYYEKKMPSPGRLTLANANAIKQAAQDSRELEEKLLREAESLLNPNDLWLWDILDKDIYANPVLPVGLQEIPESEAKSLVQMNEELIRYRRSLVDLLNRRFGVQRIETLPRQTKFDTALHQADEESKIKTVSPDLHLLIAGVKSSGFTRNGQTIRKPKVSYYVCSVEPPAAAPLAVTETLREVPAESSVPLTETQSGETPVPLDVPVTMRNQGIPI